MNKDLWALIDLLLTCWQLLAFALLLLCWQWLRPIHRWLVDLIYKWWEKNLMSSATKDAKLGLVRERVKGLIHSLFFTAYMLILVYAVLLCFDSSSDIFGEVITPILSVIVLSPMAYKLWTYRTTDKEAEEVEREEQAREREAQEREREAQAREREAQARDREVQEREREVQEREREAQARDREVQARDREKQADFARYSQGMQLITSSSGLQKVAGINQLIRVSEQTREYDEQIKYVFIETLKTPPSASNIEQLPNSYAQSIIKWLYKRYYEKGLDFYAPTVNLFIKNQTFDLADEDCRRGLLWLLILSGVRQDIIIHFDNSEISYKLSSCNIVVHDDVATLRDLVVSVRSQARDLGNDTETISRFSELFELLQKERREIRESMSKANEQPTA